MKRFLLSMLAVVALGLFGARATEVSITWSQQGYSNGADVTTVKMDDNVTLTFDKGSNKSNSPKYYNTGTGVRLYPGNTLTISVPAGYKLDKVTFGTATGSNVFNSESTASTGNFSINEGTAAWTSTDETTSVVITEGGSSGHVRIQSTKVEYSKVITDPDGVAAPTISFDESTATVTMACATEDAAIYYTLDGEAPTAASTLYEAPFVLEESCTVKAIAIKGEKESSVATYTAKVNAKAANIAEMLAKAPAKGDQVLVNFPMTVVYVNGQYVYVVDAEGDATMLYQSNTLNAGDVVPAGWVATNGLYNGLVEWTGTLTASTETADFTIAEVESVGESDVHRVVVLKGVTFDATTPSAKSNFDATLADGSTLAFYNKFKIASVEAGTYNVKLAVGIYVTSSATTVQAYPIEYTLAPAELSDADPVITPTEIVAGEDGVFSFTAPANFVNGVSDLTLSVSDDEENFIIDGFDYIAGDVPATVTVTAAWEAGTLYKAGSKTFEITIKERELVDAEIDLTPTEVEVGDEGTFTIAAPEGFLAEVTDFALTSDNEEVLFVLDKEYAAMAIGTATVTATWSQTKTYKAGSKTFTVTVTPKLVKETVTTTFDQFNSGWSPAFPTSKVSSSDIITSEKGELSITHDLTYWNKSGSAILLQKEGGYLVLSEVQGVLKSVTIHSGSSCSKDAVVNVSAGENDLGTLALNEKDKDYVITVTDKKIVNPIIKIAATSAANVQISSITVETEVTVKPSAGFSFAKEELSAVVATGRANNPLVDVPAGVAVSYASSNEEVAAVDGEGNVYLLGVGTATITATSEETAEYASTSASYTLVVEAFEFIVKIEDEVLETYYDEFEELYQAMGVANVGQTMTIDTNLGEEAMVMIVNEAEGMLASPVTFTKGGMQMYMAQAMIMVDDEPMPVGALMVAVQVNVPHVVPETLYLHVKEVGGTFAFDKAIAMEKHEEAGKFVADVNIGTRDVDSQPITVHYVFTTHMPAAAQPVEGAPRRAEAADHWATLTEGHIYHGGEESKVNAADVTSEAGLVPFEEVVSGGKNNFVVDVNTPQAVTTIERVGVVTGIENVVVEDASEAIYYDLTGRRVAKPANGTYIRVCDGKATKVAIR